VDADTSKASPRRRSTLRAITVPSAVVVTLAAGLGARPTAPTALCWSAQAVVAIPAAAPSATTVSSAVRGPDRPRCDASCRRSSQTPDVDAASARMRAIPGDRHDA
jgi:hypothetical protein